MCNALGKRIHGTGFETKGIDIERSTRRVCWPKYLISILREIMS